MQILLQVLELLFKIVATTSGVLAIYISVKKILKTTKKERIQRDVPK